jgi:hypothetical protein
MSLRSCSREEEVRSMQVAGHWPRACPQELGDHLRSCKACSEVLLVTQSFRQERAVAAAVAQLPAPGAIWWRAQLRRRNEAMEQVSKPILGAYVFALATTVLVALAFVLSQARHGLRWLDWLGQQLPASDQHSPPPSVLTALNPGSGLAVMISVFATLVLVGALIVYLADERN